MWSWVLTTISVLGLYYAGKRMWQGWLLGLLAQPVWLTYALATRQYGFVLSCLAFGYVNASNLLRWRRDAASTDVEREAMTARLALIKIIATNHVMGDDQKVDRIKAVLRRGT